MTHYPINGDKNLIAVCRTKGMIRKTTDRALVTCPKCKAALEVNGGNR